MLEIEYSRYEFHGEPEVVRAPLWAFLFDVPYLAVFNVFPPLHLLNRILESGGSQGGMGPGATWRPFRISGEDYDELISVALNPDRNVLRKIARYPDQRFIRDTAFDRLNDHDEWIVAVSRKYGNIAGQEK